MNNFFALSEPEQRAVIEQAARRMGLPVQAVEKDVWVTAVLQLLFSLPFADRLVFKGGTSLSKVWRVIERFSEDIDLAIDRELFGLSGDLTIRQIKSLRKESSLFVKNDLCQALQKQIEASGLATLCTVEPEEDGTGDKTYPEPRRIFVRYHPLFGALTYLLPEVVLEVGSRSLFEPTARQKVKSIVSESLPVDTDLAQVEVVAAVPAKTFLEKAFLLHEIFMGQGPKEANRKSRHLYDLERMMDSDFATKAVSDDELWRTIHHHRSLFTRVGGVDYSADVRPMLTVVPPAEWLNDWRKDYEAMRNSMIYGNALPFDQLLQRLEQLQNRFRNR